MTQSHGPHHHTETPPATHTSYPNLKNVVLDEPKDMVNMGVIKESHSGWSSLVALVPKEDSSVHFCVDFRKVNVVVKFDTYRKPRT